MIKMLGEILTIFVITGGIWYGIYSRKERELLNRLQEMINQAKLGHLSRTEISEEKYSALENSLKRYLDDSLLSSENQQEQTNMIQGLISDISHQTLTPISNLKIYGEILSEQSEEKSEIIETILEQTEKLEFLIQSLVKLSRLENGIISVHPEEISITELLENIQREYQAKAREKDIDLKVCDTKERAVYDLKWTAEAIGNIVDNAIKYTLEGGKIQINVQQYTFFLKLDIIDNGIGIEEEEIPRIFERFYRSFSVEDYKGVGIGLYLSREIIQKQKGYIKVSSHKGKGSTFSVFLPMEKI